MTTNNGYASRDQLLSPGKRRYKDVTLPVSELKVRIRSLMEHESESFQSELFSRGKVQTDKAVSSYRRLIVLCVCGPESDAPLLGKNDFDALNGWDGADVNHLGRECEAWCGFVDGEIGKMEKNSATATGSN